MYVYMHMLLFCFLGTPSPPQSPGWWYGIPIVAVQDMELEEKPGTMNAGELGALYASVNHERS